jgi:predicted hydrocarbon binding protein
MQYTLRDTIESEVGTEGADRIFYTAGKLAGQELYHHIIKDAPDLPAFVTAVQEALKTLNIGIFRVEKADPENGSFVFTVSEDVDCSGLPELHYSVCTYDEGFIAGLMECFSGQKFRVKEVDCWCMGDRTCRFSVDRTE